VDVSAAAVDKYVADVVDSAVVISDDGLLCCCWSSECTIEEIHSHQRSATAADIIASLKCGWQGRARS